MSRRVDLGAEELRLEAAEQDLRPPLAGRLPTFSLDARYNLLVPATLMDYYVGVLDPETLP